MTFGMHDCHNQYRPVLDFIHQAELKPPGQTNSDTWRRLLEDIWVILKARYQRCHISFEPLGKPLSNIVVPCNRVGNVLIGLLEKNDPICHELLQPVPLLHFFPGYPRFRVSIVALEAGTDYSQFFFTQGCILIREMVLQQFQDGAFFLLGQLLYFMKNRFYAHSLPPHFANVSEFSCHCQAYLLHPEPMHRLVPEVLGGLQDN